MPGVVKYHNEHTPVRLWRSKSITDLLDPKFSGRTIQIERDRRQMRISFHLVLHPQRERITSNNVRNRVREDDDRRIARTGKANHSNCAEQRATFAFKQP